MLRLASLLPSVPRVLAALSLLALLVAPACESKKKVKAQLYFKDLRPPLGIKVKVVKDISKTAGGGESIVRVVVDPDVDRDDLDRLMASFERQTKARTGFSGGAVAKVDIRFYVSEGKAKAEGDDWIASVQRTSNTGEAKLVNKQKLPLLKWAKKALGPMPQYTKEKPTILADPKAMTLEITLPFVKDDGTGEPVEKVTFNRACRTWASLVLPLFDKLEKLKKLTFIGSHKGNTVFKVWVTREQATQLDLRKVEESLGAFQGKLINKRLAKQITDKKMATETAKQRKKVYKEVLSRLPKEQVTVDKALK